jgi:hypothetical protein
MIFVFLFHSPTEQPHRATIFFRKYPCLPKYQWCSQPLHSMIRGMEESSELPVPASKIDSTTVPLAVLLIVKQKITYWQTQLAFQFMKVLLQTELTLVMPAIPVYWLYFRHPEW